MIAFPTIWRMGDHCCSDLLAAVFSFLKCKQSFSWDVFLPQAHLMAILFVHVKVDICVKHCFSQLLHIFTLLMSLYQKPMLFGVC